jgi:hypothetical protein
MAAVTRNGIVIAPEESTKRRSSVPPLSRTANPPPIGMRISTSAASTRWELKAMIAANAIAKGRLRNRLVFMVCPHRALYRRA